MDDQEEAPDLNPDDQLSSDSDDDDRFYFLRLKTLKNLKQHRLALHREEMALSSQIKSLKQTLDGSRLEDELEKLHQAYAEKEDKISTQDQHLLNLYQENQALVARCENINSEQQLDKEYQVFFDKMKQDMHEKLMIIEHLQSSNEAHLTTIKELTTNNKDLVMQLEKAMVFGGTNVDQPMSTSGERGQLPHVYVGVSDVEKKEERRLDPGVKVQIKSWWRRQADKVVKGMGTLRLQFTCCLGVRTHKRLVVRVVPVVNSIMDIGMPPVCVGMPPVSI